MSDRGEGPARPPALLLAGSGEFLPTMTGIDVELLRLTPGRPPRVAILPTAAGLELSVESWITMGVQHFTELGCQAFGVWATDRAGVEDLANAAAVESADLVYLSGGKPGYLVETLRGSAVWRAIEAVRRRGGSLAGSSAGAMAQGTFTLAGGPGRPNSATWGWAPGLGILDLGVIPHYNRMGPERATPLAEMAPPGLLVYGIDEETAVLIGPEARVLGRGTVTVWRDGCPEVFRAGQRLPSLPTRLS